MHTLEELHLAARDLRVKAAEQETDLLRFQFEQLAGAYEQAASMQEAHEQRGRLADIGLQGCLPDKPITRPGWATAIA